MKKVRRYIERLLPVVAALALVSCNLDELDEVKKPIDPNGRVGSLVIESLVINTDNENLDRGSNSATRAEGDNKFRVPNPNGAEEDTANYWIEVLDADGEVVDINGDDAGTGMTVEDINKLETEITLPDGSEMTIKGAVLPPGMYTVWAYKDSSKGKNIQNVTPEGATEGSTVAYYIGHQEVEVLSTEDLEGDAKSTPVDITCKLAQTLVTVEMSADMEEWFDVTNYYGVEGGTQLQTTVTIAPETPEENEKYSHTFPYDTNHGVKDADGNVVKGGPFVYFKDHVGPNSQEGNTMVFKMEGVYLNISADDKDAAWDDLKENEQSTYYENLICVSMEREYTNVKAAQWRRISIDIDHDTEGDVRFEVTINSYVFDEEVEVDVQTMFFSMNEYQEEAVPDIDPLAPSVTLNTTDKSTTAIIASDLIEHNQWRNLLQMTVTPSDDTTIKEVYVEVLGDKDLLEAVKGAGYTDGRVNLLPNTATASQTTSYFDVEMSGNNVQVTLTYDGMNALQNNYKGTHSVRVWTKDSEDRMKYTDLTIKSGGTSGGNIGSASGSGSGSGGGNIPGLSVNWSSTEINITAGVESERVYVDIEAEEGIAGLIVQIDSNVLTEEELGSVGLSNRMDLFAPATYQMESMLRALGFLPYDEDNGYVNDDDKSMPAYGYDEFRVWKEDESEIDPDRTSPLSGLTEERFEVTQFMDMLAMLGNSTNTFTLTVTDAKGKTVSSSATIICSQK